MDDLRKQKESEMRLNVPSENGELEQGELEQGNFELGALQSDSKLIQRDVPALPAHSQSTTSFLKLSGSKMRRLVFLHQGCYLGITLSLLPLFVPSQIASNLVPMIWLSLFVELIGVLSLIGPTPTILSPVKFALRSMLFILAAPALFLVICSYFASSLPKQVLEFAIAPATLSAALTFYLLTPLFKHIEHVLKDTGQTRLINILVNNGLNLGAQISIMLFPAWLLGVQHKLWEQLIPFFAFWGFVAFAIATRTLIAKVTQLQESN